MDDVRSVYLKMLWQKTEKSILKEYPAVQEFELEPFHLVNAYLVRRAIEHKINTLFLVPGKDYRNAYHTPTLLMLAIETFLKNWVENSYEIEEGDVLLEPNGSTRKIISKSRNEFHWKRLDSANSRGRMTEMQARKYPIITGDWRQTKLKTKLKTYKSFFMELFSCREDEIPYKFREKTLVIASKKVTNELKKISLKGKSVYKSFPFEYVWQKRDGSIGRDCNLPIEPLIYITTDFELAKDHLLSSINENIETLVLIGSSQYRDNIPSLTNALNRHQIKSVILVGSEDVDHLPDLHKWRWYAPEINLLNGQENKSIEINPVESDEIELALQSTSFAIKAIEDDYEIMLSSLNKHLRGFSKIIVPSTDSRLNQLAQQAWGQFNLEGKEIVSDAFYEASYDDEDTENWPVIQEQFERLFKAVIRSRDKIQALKEHRQIKHIVVPKNQIEAWQSEGKTLGKVKFISFPEFKNLQTKKPSSVAFFGFYGMEHFKAMTKSPHYCWLLLNPHEKDFFQLCQTKYENSLLAELKSDWRKKLSDVEFEMPPKEESLSDLLKRFVENGLSEANVYSQDAKDYELLIRFENGEEKASYSNHRFLVKNGNGYQEMDANFLKKGDTVVEYNNIEKEKLYEVALQADATDVFSKIEESSSIWKDALRNHFLKTRLDEDTYHQKLKNLGLKVSIGTFRRWLRPNCPVRFPQREKDLHAIRLMVNNPLLNAKLGKIFQYRANYKSIMIALGQGLSDETTTYLKTGQKGKMFRQFSGKQIQSILNHNIQHKTISQINVIKNGQPIPSI